MPPSISATGPIGSLPTVTRSRGPGLPARRGRDARPQFRPPGFRAGCRGAGAVLGRSRHGLVDDGRGAAGRLHAKPIMASLRKLQDRSEDAIYWPGHGGPVRDPARLRQGADRASADGGRPRSCAASRPATATDRDRSCRTSTATSRPRFAAPRASRSWPMSSTSSNDGAAGRRRTAASLKATLRDARDVPHDVGVAGGRRPATGCALAFSADVAPPETRRRRGCRRGFRPASGADADRHVVGQAPSRASVATDVDMAGAEFSA